MIKDNFIVKNCCKTCSLLPTKCLFFTTNVSTRYSSINQGNRRSVWKRVQHKNTQFKTKYILKSWGRGTDQSLPWADLALSVSLLGRMPCGIIIHDLIYTSSWICYHTIICPTTYMASAILDQKCSPYFI